MSGNMVGTAACLDVGDAKADVANVLGCAMDSAEKENGGTKVLRPNFQWCSKLGLNVATVRPLRRKGSSEMSPIRSHSSALTSSFSPARTSPDLIFSRAQIRSPRYTIERNFTQTCPFSFDLRDSMQRVARERKLEELRQIEERHLSVKFKANPVRKYKPLMVQQSTRQLTIPRLPFSSGETRK